MKATGRAVRPALGLDGSRLSSGGMGPMWSVRGLSGSDEPRKARGRAATDLNGPAERSVGSTRRGARSVSEVCREH